MMIRVGVMSEHKTNQCNILADALMCLVWIATDEFLPFLYSVLHAKDASSSSPHSFPPSPVDPCSPLLFSVPCIPLCRLCLGLGGSEEDHGRHRESSGGTDYVHNGQSCGERGVTIVIMAVVGW